MSIKKELFGKMPDGAEVYRYTLENANGIKVKILNYGGVINQLIVPDRNGKQTDIVGGYDDLDSYRNAGGYQGALIGRWANRIADGKFTLEGKEYVLFVDKASGQHLHGGNVGFNAKIWDVVEIDGDEPALKLSIVSPDGEEGFPGTLELTVTYTLTNENGIVINYRATTDKTTPINLTNHAYFNLGGYAAGSVHPTQLWIDADSYLPTNDKLIPTGEIRSVEGTPFDFREAKTIGQDIGADSIDLKLAGGYDHCFNFVGGESKEPVLRIKAYDPVSGRLMEVYTNQPCVQLYTGNFLNEAEFPFKGGYPQAVQTLFCLETQHMPDSVNKPHFTKGTLAPGEVYDYTTEYRFKTK